MIHIEKNGMAVKNLIQIIFFWAWSNQSFSKLTRTWFNHVRKKKDSGILVFAYIATKFNAVFAKNNNL